MALGQKVGEKTLDTYDVAIRFSGCMTHATITYNDESNKVLNAQLCMHIFPSDEHYYSKCSLVKVVAHSRNFNEL